MNMHVPFLDLKKQHEALAGEIGPALDAVLGRGDFILGGDVKAFEQEFAAYTGSRFAVGLNSGTDALFLSLKALGVGEGDEVVVPAFTFIATANAVSYCGAKPVFCDIDPATFCMNARGLKAAATARTKAVIPVHLFGQCCDMGPLLASAKKTGIAVIEDACQSHGAGCTIAGSTRKAGSLGETGCFSFYPTKNLGGWGDGGMTVTSDEGIYRKLLLLRDCGRTSRYEHSVVGYNSRLDTAQAALLRLKLKKLDEWNQMRRHHAELYTKLLSVIPGVTCPATLPGNSHVYHIYALLVPERDRLIEHLKSREIGVAVNYPIPLHLQKAYARLGHAPGDFPVSETACGKVISLPMHPFLETRHIRYVCETIRDFYKK